MTTHVLKPLAIALLLGITPLSISTAYAVAAVTGPAGPTGATGAKGDTGLPGAAGTNGLPGATGATGATGLTGAAGAKGINGTNGATGAQGLTGAIGPSGGVKGDTGATGAAGVKGDTGAAGATGPAGAAGTGSAGGSAAIHVIGDSYAGGIVFWVDPDGEHGLIAAHADLNAGQGIRWYNGAFKNIGTTSGMYAGIRNTILIIASQVNDTYNGMYAAKAVAEYASCSTDNNACYNDWYMPSIHELYLLYNQKDVVGGFSASPYWSSTGEGVGAYYVQFGTGVVNNFHKDGTFVIRPIRAF